MRRSTAIWFGVAGLSGFVRYGLEYADPAYYDATSAIDYAAVVSQTLFGVATGIALIFLWRDPPVARGSLFLLFAGIGAGAEGMGNLFEDAFGIEDAVWVFFGGGILMLVSLIIAGIAALTVRSPRRWSGLFLLFGAPGAMLGFGAVMMAVSWILFGLWIIYEHRAFVIALAVAAIAAVTYSIYLYGADVIAEVF